MRNIAHRRTAGIVAGLAAVTLIAAGCSDDKKDTASSTTTSVAASEASTSASSSETPKSETNTSTSKGAEENGDVKLKAANGTEVTLTGPIAAKYSAATEAQKKDLGTPLAGDHNAGKRESGVVFQQFTGGVITAKNDEAGTPAYITWGKIRDAWNVERLPDGTPAKSGEKGSNGSAGPLGVATSDETTEGDLKVSTFEHGKITYNTKTGKVKVTVNGKEVPAE
ncbi:MAG: hypothetical protein QM658_06030 [Gordonia sp. (in: high G+C Gram-positive bacteria)]